MTDKGEVCSTTCPVAQGVEVVKQGQRRWVEPHWFRGQSYVKIGWDWVKLALSRGDGYAFTYHEDPRERVCPAPSFHDSLARSPRPFLCELE
jgi:hypothetical protein